MEYANSKMALLISEYVHSARDREILRLRYLEGHTYERIAGEVYMSPRQIQNIDYKFRRQVLVKHYQELS